MGFGMGKIENRKMKSRGEATKMRWGKTLLFKSDGHNVLFDKRKVKNISNKMYI